MTPKFVPNTIIKTLGIEKPYTYSLHMPNKEMACRKHNLRLGDPNNEPGHIIPERYRAPLIDKGPFKEAINSHFGPSVMEDNIRNKKKDRLAENSTWNYYDSIHNRRRRFNNEEHSTVVVREMIVHIGDMDYHPDSETCCKTYEKFFTETITKKFPNIYPLLCCVHDDEITKDGWGAPHGHYDCVFEAHALPYDKRAEEKKRRAQRKKEIMAECEKKGIPFNKNKYYKLMRKEMGEIHGVYLLNGPLLQISKSAALSEMGYFDDENETAYEKLQKAQRAALAEVARSFGLNIADNLTPYHKMMPKDQYISYSKDDNVKCNKVLLRDTYSMGQALDLEHKIIKEIQKSLQKCKEKENELAEREKKLKGQEEHYKYLANCEELRKDYLIELLEGLPSPLQGKDLEVLKDFILFSSGYNALEIDAYKPIFNNILNATPEVFREIADEMEKKKYPNFKEYYEKEISHQVFQSMNKSLIDKYVRQLRIRPKVISSHFLREGYAMESKAATYKLLDIRDYDYENSNDQGYSR